MKDRVFDKISKKTATLADVKTKLEKVRSELERHRRIKPATKSPDAELEYELDGNYVVLVTRDIYELLSGDNYFFNIFDGVPVEVIPGVAQVFLGKEVL